MVLQHVHRCSDSPPIERGVRRPQWKWLHMISTAKSEKAMKHLFCSLNTHAWRLEPPWKKCNYPESAMLGRPQVILPLTAPLNPAFQGTGHMSKAILDSLSQPISQLSTTEWSLWTPRGTEESPRPRPAWVANHSIRRCNKMAFTLSHYVLGLVVMQGL